MSIYFYVHSAHNKQATRKAGCNVVVFVVLLFCFCLFFLVFFPLLVVLFCIFCFFWFFLFSSFSFIYFGVLILYKISKILIFIVVFSINSYTKNKLWSITLKYSVNNDLSIEYLDDTVNNYIFNFFMVILNVFN